MKYEELVTAVKDQFMQADVSRIQEHIAYQFNIEGEAEGAFYAEVSDGCLSIEPYEYYDRDVLFTTTAETLLNIVKGKMDAVEAFTDGKLKVEGNFDKALKLNEFTRRETTEKTGVKKNLATKAAVAKTIVKNKVAKAGEEKSAGKKNVDKKAGSTKTVEVKGAAN